MRVYFIHGGKRVWLSSWLETAGWPLMLVPISISYYRRRRRHSPTGTRFFLMKPTLFLYAASMGIITGFDNYLYAFGVARLPVTTNALIIASQLPFTAGFAYLPVKQKFTSYAINAVVLLYVGGGILAMHASGDRPKGESSKEYAAGFLITVVAAALYGLILPLVELAYKKAKQTVTYSFVLEFQMVMSFFATAFCTVGMLIDKDFQTFYLGAIGVIFCASSLLSGVLIAVLLPVTEILAVIFYKESFKAEKGVSLRLSLWGFFSYFYGEMKHSKKKQQQSNSPETEIPDL